MVDNQPGAQLVIDLIEVGGGAVRVVVDGEIDLSTGALFRGALRDALDSGQPVELDLNRVTFIDSTGVGHLVELTAPLTATSRVRLVNPSHQVVRVLVMQGLAPMFDL